MVETQNAHKTIQKYSCKKIVFVMLFNKITKEFSHQESFWETKSSLSRCSRRWHWPPTSVPASRRSKPLSALCWTPSSWLWTSWSQRWGFLSRRHKPLWSGTTRNVLSPMPHFCLCSWMNKWEKSVHLLYLYTPDVEAGEGKTKEAQSNRHIFPIHQLFRCEVSIMNVQIKENT